MRAACIAAGRACHDRCGSGTTFAAMAALSAAVLLSAGVLGVAHAEPGHFEGNWHLDIQASDPVEKHLERLRKERLAAGRFYGPRPDGSLEREAERQGPGYHMKERYDELVSSARAAKRLRAPLRVGPAAALLGATTIAIAWDEQAFTINYDEDFERIVRPNAAGRVFTASGRELVNDQLGHGLAYWEDGQLLIETSLRPRGRLYERISLSPDKNVLRIELAMERPQWPDKLEVVRVFRGEP